LNISQVGARFNPYPPELAGCQRCPRLVAHREAVALTKRRAFANESYWGAPVPGFGDPAARLLIVGLAPGAHGSNRTGRMFTGDASGDFLYPALHRAGLANQGLARSRDDGLELQGVWITAVGRCAPPGNKPLPSELANCRPHFAAEFDHLSTVRVLLALGRIAHDGVLTLWRERGLQTTLSAHPFAHGALHTIDHLAGAERAQVRPLIDSFHVSRQNTNTGRLSVAMFDQVLTRAKTLAGLP